MENYREKMKQILRNYWRTGDEINLVGCFFEEGRKCQLCGYYPIKYNFTLENSRTKEKLIVCSNCVHNFKKAMHDLGENVIIKSSNIKIASFINNKYPDTVNIIHTNSENYDGELENYVHFFGECNKFTEF